ncbi:MAG: Altered inheritance of mitochondria protein 18 mitochondrial [Alyxoria varia]|nr:MAG: Altered inheritance of mitochondria protein 18 mitochondrial [Alyxoria varia]
MATRYADPTGRWRKYEDPSEEIHEDMRPRNPLNYVEQERMGKLRNMVIKKKMSALALGAGFLIVVQLFLFFTYGDEPRKKKKKQTEKLDSGKDDKEFEGKDVIVVSTKPGQPEVKLDAQGNELLETGNSSVPHIPRTIRLPAPSSTSSQATSSSPSNILNTQQPRSDSPQAPDVLGSSATPSPSDQEKTEEYTLLGHGIRTVSFLRVQVYVLGFYVRTSDLPALQSAFVHHAAGAATATSLIPMEKEQLRNKLMDPAESARIWDVVLKDTNIRSCMRVSPTRSTDFAHLRDGWVRGLTGKTQEATEAAREEAKKAKESGQYETQLEKFDDDEFGSSVGAFKALFSGRGKTPKGSVILLMRDEQGVLSAAFQSQGLAVSASMPERDDLGSVTDGRISRLVWLNYLGGKNVSSEDARKSVVEGVMELVERPVGTVGMGAP